MCAQHGRDPEVCKSSHKVTTASVAKRTCASPMYPLGEYETAARRPANSVLHNARLREVAGIVTPAWDESLAECLREVVRAR